MDDPTTVVTLDEILKDSPAYCGDARFWDISRAIMHDAALSIAMFWVDLWTVFVRGERGRRRCLRPFGLVAPLLP